MSTKIEWTDETWNPVVGCQKVSEGCQNCYAEKMARRLACMGKKKYMPVVHWVNDGQPSHWTGAIQTDEAALLVPQRWKNPRRVFVVSMGDLFYESVPFEFIDQVFAIMALCPQHTFQVLTKRPERMREYLTTPMRLEEIYLWWNSYSGTSPEAQGWPLPNVWLGVTAENQEQADKRIPVLLSTPAAKRFVSIEPMLGPVDLHNLGWGPHGGAVAWQNKEGRKLDWVIIGGESGPGARPMQADWARSVRDQCQAAGVPFLFKQWGGVNKKKAGRLLDGRTWDEFPDDQRKATS